MSDPVTLADRAPAVSNRRAMFRQAAGAAVFGGMPAVLVSDGGFGGVGVVFVSDGTDPEEADFTPPGVAGRPAVGFGSPCGGGVEGDLVSSGIGRRHRTPAQIYS